MQMRWRIPHVSGQELDISIEAGTQIFIVGPNGSGKSSLIQHAVTSFGAQNVRRISAHRQTWLNSSEINLTPHSRRRYDADIFKRETQALNRWREQNPQQKIESVLFDLTAKENNLARQIMSKAYADDHVGIDEIVDKERPVFEQLNKLLSLGGFSVAIENSDGESILAQHSDSEGPYGIERMSDGERNAVILAANVLTVRPGIVLLIDEPERHLHRSIINPFLSALFELREDCAFVVSTHDTALPPVGTDSSVLILSSCQWRGESATAWDIKLLQEDFSLPEDLKRAILGARRQILFVEGTSESMDVQLYSVLYPKITVMPSRSCEEVIRAVVGLRNAAEYHDVESFGLVDGDNRSKHDVSSLQENGIFALDQYSVESLYFCADSMEAVAGWQALSLGGDPSQMLEKAVVDALNELRQHEVAERMAARRCERQVQVRAQLQMPTWKSIIDGSTHTIELDTQAWYEQELSNFEELLQKKDIETLIARYPVRHSKVIERIVKAFNLNSQTYKKTLLSRVRNDHGLADKIRKRIGPLSKLLIS